MKLDQLLYFTEVAKLQHLGKASKILGISPSAVSHSISSLEEELGQELFVRQGKRLFLTSHGKLLAEKAKLILDQVTELQDIMTSKSVQLQGSFKLGGTHGVASSLLVPAWLGLQQAHPALVGEVQTLRSGEVVLRCASGELDFGVCFSPQAHPELEKSVLRQGKLLISVRKGHPILRLKTDRERIEALGRLPAVAVKASQGIENCERHPLIEALGIKRQIKLIYDSDQVALSYLEKSDAWGLFPDWSLQESAAVAALKSQPKADYEIAAIWPRRRYLVQALRALLETLASRLAP